MTGQFSWRSGLRSLALLLTLTGAVYAGPVIIDGTDANDHGSATATENLTGWLYMQKAFENLASQCATCTKVVRVLGTTAGSSSRSAVDSAFTKSTLPAAGWTLVYVAEAGIAATLTALSPATTGILHIPTVGLNGGDLSDAALTTINGQGAAIAAFVNAGGALFAMGEDAPTPFGWLTAVLPGIVVNFADDGGTPILLTPAGAAAFPGLTNAVLAGAIPWHNYFSGNFGTLQVLGTSQDGGATRGVILGGGAGTRLGSLNSGWDSPFQIRYSANLNLGDSVVNITNSGARGAGLAAGTSASTTGAICANVYAFSPDEQMISCCSCPVTPNGLVSLSARQDLISNTLTPAVPTSIVIKLYATVPIGGLCSGSAAAPGAPAFGMLAYGTTVHAAAVTGADLAVTETPFLPATLSGSSNNRFDGIGELARLTSLCNFINANGSGFGICRSCRLGGLGAGRL